MHDEFESLDPSRTLADFGERLLVREFLVPRYNRDSGSIGDDCVTLPGRPGWVVATTDPCPPPAAWALGYTDYYYFGWLLATINLSDLAAAGAEPMGLLTCLQLPRDMLISDFARLLDGIDDCCNTSGTRVLGGNLKEGTTADISGTALGHCDTLPLRRAGARPGDEVYVLGRLGAFWAGYLGESRYKTRCEELLVHLRSAVLTPKPLTDAGIRLRQAALVSSCMDNSDGLLPSLWLLAEASNVSIELDVDRFLFESEVLQVAEIAEVDPWRLALGWGDWSLVFTASPEVAGKLQEIAASCGLPLSPIGSVRRGDGVRARIGEACGIPMRLESERFAKDSWFQTGLESYIDTFLTSPLIAE